MYKMRYLFHFSSGFQCKIVFDTAYITLVLNIVIGVFTNILLQLSADISFAITVLDCAFFSFLFDCTFFYYPLVCAFFSSPFDCAFYYYLLDCAFF